MALLHFVGNGVSDGKEGLTVPLKKCPIKSYILYEKLLNIQVQKTFLT